MLHAACLQCKAQWPVCAEMIPSLFGDSAIDPHQIVRALSRRSQRCVPDVSYLWGTSAPGLASPLPHLLDPCALAGSCSRIGMLSASCTLHVVRQLYVACCPPAVRCMLSASCTLHVVRQWCVGRQRPLPNRSMHAPILGGRLFIPRDMVSNTTWYP
jgi:hypothetical protein